MSRFCGFLLVASLLVTSASACATGGSSQQGQGDASVVSVGELYSKTAQFEGKTVTLRGVFRGWSGCQNNTRMQTRSDWVLTDGDACIFITGGLPRGVDPASKDDVGKSVSVTGRLLLDNGKLFLKYLEP